VHALESQVRQCSGSQHFRHLAELEKRPGRKENLTPRGSFGYSGPPRWLKYGTSLQYHKPGIEEVGRGSHNPGLHIMFSCNALHNQHQIRNEKHKLFDAIAFVVKREMGIASLQRRWWCPS
jgi:hypothetical protein